MTGADGLVGRDPDLSMALRLAYFAGYLENASIVRDKKEALIALLLSAASRQAGGTLAA